jgi:sporulation protein YlmC with PRC-barrel domain
LSSTGIINVNSRAIRLYLAASQADRAPDLAETRQLVPPYWEDRVRKFWSQSFWISNLSTGCRVSSPQGGNVVVHKIAYFNQLSGAELRDWLGNPLGTIKDAVLEPESGKISFFVVKMKGNGKLVLVPLRVVNIPEEG